MKKKLKHILKKTPLFDIYYNFKTKKQQVNELKAWINTPEYKRKQAPHVVKQKTLKQYASNLNLKILVETGTYYGDMIEALKNNFDILYSIELSDELHKQAIERFSKIKKVNLVCGDSGTELKHIVDKLEQPAIFWLDGHYSCGITAKGDKDTPIFEEINCILNSKKLNHVILVDDARCFGVLPDYPSIEKLTNYIKLRAPNANIETKNDIIRIILNL